MTLFMGMLNQTAAERNLTARNCSGNRDDRAA